MKQHEPNLAPANKPLIAIIGGGYSGMAAAIRVTELGGRAIVYEAARILGGRARRVDYLDRTLDNGQHILSGAYRELLRLMNVIGLSAKVYDRVPLLLNMPPDFRLAAPLLPAPLHVAFALLGAKGLTLADKFKAIRMMRALKKSQFSVDNNWVVATLLREHKQSPKLIKYLWAPLAVSALNTPIDKASAQVFVNVLRDALGGAREASDLLLPTVDLTALFPAPAATWVSAHGGEIKLGQRVSAICVDANKVHISVGDNSSDFEAVDAVVIAVGPHQRTPFQRAISGNNSTKPDSTINFQSITTLYFGFETPLSLPQPMLGKSAGLAQWFFDRRQLSDRASDTELIISAVISASGPHDEIDNDTLTSLVLAELKEFIPTLPAASWSKVIREKFATFSCTPNAPRPSLFTACPLLFLAGDDIANPLHLYPATLEAAAQNGVNAANAAMTLFSIAASST